MRVPLADLPSQYQSMKGEIDDAVQRVLSSGSFILGPEVASLEEEMAAATGAAFAVGVNSGTDALLLALLACGVGKGDEVVTTPFTFVATIEAIVHAGATPVFADIDPVTFNVEPERVSRAIGPRTRAIMPVDLFGQMADRAALGSLASANGCSVVWDSAQAIGSMYNDLPVGSYSDCATLSFFPTKNLGGCGDGGMVLTRSVDIHARLLKLRFHGSGGGYYYDQIGYCSRLDGIQAAILRVKLGHLGQWTASRRRHAATYRSALQGCPVQLPAENGAAYHTYHQFTIRHPRRDELKAYLKDRGIDSGIYYPAPLHTQSGYAWLGYSAGDFPEAERAAAEVLSLPVHPGLTDEQVQYAAQAVREFITG
ncbi:MAG: DegT/DnrJ/EryC1/StrS family aminotransferase [Armatimonadetes bacterium]|nr:DegT/DnrJ/EryC1/StrS family aminotransferase [Armatimonadota bacterium]